MRASSLGKCSLWAAAVFGVVLGAAAPAESALQSADVVFEGTVLGGPDAVRADLGIEGYDGATRFRFQAARYFKGQLGQAPAIYTIDQGTACGRYYEPGSTYLVYGYLLENGLLTDSLCSRTRLISSAAVDLAVLGAGTAPDPGVTPRDVVVEQSEEADGGCSVSAPGGSPGGVALLSSLLALALGRRFKARRAGIRPAPPRRPR
jgi:hypothetical protein